MTPPYPSLGSGHAPALDPERLLEHAGWMRQLARHLVGDRDRAEDLTQETWLRALESPPGTGLPLRAWLRVVMRNLLRREHRAAARRTDRERRSAAERPTAAEDAPATLARAAAHRSLLQAVLELEEPYRTTLLLRYFEELPPRRIAQRTGTPVATVKTRLARGLERLRVLLRAEHRDASDAWLLALVPVLRPPTGGSLSGLSLPSVARPSLSKLLPASIGTLVVNAKLISVSLLAAAAVGTGYLLLEGPLPDSGPGLQLEPPLARGSSSSRRWPGAPCPNRRRPCPWRRPNRGPRRARVPSASPSPPCRHRTPRPRRRRPWRRSCAVASSISRVAAWRTSRWWRRALRRTRRSRCAAARTVASSCASSARRGSRSGRASGSPC